MEFKAMESIRFGWETFKKRGWYLVGAYCVAYVVYMVASQIVTRLTAGEGSFLSFVAAVAQLALQTFFGMGIMAFILKAHDDVASVQLTDLWYPEPFWKYFGTTILYGLAVFVGLILLVIPGIIAVIVYQFAPYLVIDRGLHPIEALRESARITRGSRWELLFLLLGVFVLNIAGALLLLVGLVVSVPVTALAIAHAYRTLEHKANEVAKAA